MAEARQRAEWGRTGLLAMLLYNAHRDSKKSEPATFDTFNPYAPSRREARGERPPLRAYKSAFVGD